MRMRNILLASALVAAAVGTGCGQLTIRTWVQVLDTSNGHILAPALSPDPLPVTRLQGGFQGTLRVDTRALPNPLSGTIAIDDVRVAGDGGGLGTMCVWGVPGGLSGGTVFLNLLGSDSSATVTLDVLATTRVALQLNQPPSRLTQEAVFTLGEGLSIGAFTNALLTGYTDGLFATSAPFEGETELAGTPVTFVLNLNVNNKSTPPKFDADQLAFCGRFFDQQGKDLFYGMNVKGSYLRTTKVDNPKPPLIIPLADHGITPGQRVKIKRIGTFSDLNKLEDGNQGKLTGVFSSSTTLLSKTTRNRVQGAINAGSDVVTAGYWECLIFPLCWYESSDISQDFRIDPEVTVTVPNGAQYLIAAGLPDAYHWSDNSGFGFGLSIEVVP